MSEAFLKFFFGTVFFRSSSQSIVREVLLTVCVQVVFLFECSPWSVSLDLLPSMLLKDRSSTSTFGSDSYIPAKMFKNAAMGVGVCSGVLSGSILKKYCRASFQASCSSSCRENLQKKTFKGFFQKIAEEVSISKELTENNLK